MRPRMPLVIIGCALLASVADASADEVVGKWKRPNGTIAEVYGCDGKLCGKVITGDPADFEMFHGMTRVGPAQWQGSEMKHPGMPTFMTFNGTVTLSGDTLNVKGCAVGQAMCDAETWTRVH